MSTVAVKGRKYIKVLSVDQTVNGTCGDCVAVHDGELCLALPDCLTNEGNFEFKEEA